MTLLRAGDVWPALEQLVGRYGLALERVADAAQIPGSYWGQPEAGLRGASVFARADTPVHSVLHETGHVVCMTAARRAVLDTDAGGDYDEENAVCFLQILLATLVNGADAHSACRDMDRWGYTFRLGSARAWFERDATDARDWLLGHALIDADRHPTFALRQ
jgi:hypothetical protein